SAFGAAPYWPPIDPNIQEWYSPRPEQLATQHFIRLFGSAHTVSPTRIAKQCDPFATYRRVSHSPASTIWRCIAKQSARERAREDAPLGTAVPSRQRAGTS